MADSGKGGATNGARYSNEDVARMMSELAKKRTEQTTEITRVVTEESTSIKDLLKKAGETAEKHWKEDYLDGVTLGMNHATKVVGEAAKGLHSKLDDIKYAMSSTLADWVVGTIFGLGLGYVGLQLAKTQSTTNFSSWMLFSIAGFGVGFGLVVLIFGMVRGMRCRNKKVRAAEEEPAPVAEKPKAPEKPTTEEAPKKAPKKDAPKEPAKAEVDEDETDDGPAPQEPASA